MCNVASKIAATLLTLLALAGCKDKSAATISEAQEALDKANVLIEKGRYAEALEVFDSIDSLYPGEIDVRQEVVRQRPEVMTRYCEAQLAEVDSMMSFAEARRNSLLPKLVQNSVKGFSDGYSTAAAGYNPNFYSTTGIQARVNTDGDYYIVSSVTGQPLHSHSITFTTPDGSVTTPRVDYDGELSLRTSSSEVVSYFGDAPYKIGELAAKAMLADEPTATVTIHGEKVDHSIMLTPTQIESLATTWEFADNFKQLRHLSIERDRLRATLEAARSQQ